MTLSCKAFSFRYLNCAALTVLLLASTPSLSLAQERVALVVGISEYAPEVKASNLAGVRHDMESAKKIALAMGVTNDQIVFLRDSKATKATILQHLKDLGQKTPQGGRALVYFSGHGTRYFDSEVGGCVEGLLTYDGQTITHDEFAQVTKQLSQKADKVIALMDACHSGGVAEQVQRTRSVFGGDRLTSKFHLKTDANSNQCSIPSNMRTRGLLGEVTRLGALQENFVQITSSLPDEVSFDEAGKGGIATQALRDCLLGQAKDLDGSGAVSLEEIRACAQSFVDRRLQNAIGLLPHHITVRGNRNLIPVPVALTPPQKPPETEVQTESPQAPTITTIAPSKPVAELPSTAPTSAQQAPSTQIPVPSTESIPSSNSVAVVTGPVPAPSQNIAPAPIPPGLTTPVLVAPLTMPTVTPQTASLSTLNDILQQRDPRRKVDVSLDKKKLKIGQDNLQLRIRSSHPGNVYLVLLGSDAKSFYLLFPNEIDKNNRIVPGQTLNLPRPHWQVQATGPQGVDHVLVLVTEQPRSLAALKQDKDAGQSPFIFTLNDLSGRSDLIRFLVGSGSAGRAVSFGAAMISVEEIP